MRAQRPDGAFVPLWFGNKAAPGEENPTCGTARVLPALAALAPLASDGAATDAVSRGVAWIVARTDAGRVTPTAPISLDFAKLWYFERLYPLIVGVAAPRAALRR